MQTLAFAWPNAGWNVPTGQALHVPSELAPLVSL